MPRGCPADLAPHNLSTFPPSAECAEGRPGQQLWMAPAGQLGSSPDCGRTADKALGGAVPPGARGLERQSRDAASQRQPGPALVASKSREPGPEGAYEGLPGPRSPASPDGHTLQSKLWGCFILFVTQDREKERLMQKYHHKKHESSKCCLPQFECSCPTFLPSMCPLGARHFPCKVSSACMSGTRVHAAETSVGSHLILWAPRQPLW